MQIRRGGQSVSRPLSSRADSAKVAALMRVRVCYHDNCFDGAASAALFTRFYQERVDAGAEILYRGMAHKSGDVFPKGTFDGDENAVVDFRYSADPGLTWWFDHHVSAFQVAGDREHFEADTGGRKFYDPAAKSCTRFLARTVAEKFGFDLEPHRELIDWAEIIDAAAFASPEAAVALAEPALRIMTWIENNHESSLTERLIGHMSRAVPLAEIANKRWVKQPLKGILAAHAEAVELMRGRAKLDGGVVTFDVTDRSGAAFNKFIPYYLHPETRFVVGLSMTTARVKISVGSNPWLPRPRVNIAAICERYGGGGHPVVGAVSMPAAELARARTVADEIIDELRRAVAEGT